MPRSKPKLGQNFLRDSEAQRRIADALGPDLATRTVLEIGPGHGAITDLLVPRAGRLIAVEFDPALAAELTVRYAPYSHVTVLHQDILTTDLAALAGPQSGGSETLDVIGNLPYYITSDILLHLFRAAPHLRRAILMMQREVADRVSASPGTRDFGLLSATAQLHASVDSLFTLPPAAFSPPPEVHSTVLRLHFNPRFTELGVDPTSFDTFLHQLFAQKRKTAANNLRHAGFSNASLEQNWPSNISREARAEQLSLEQMATLHHTLKS